MVALHNVHPAAAANVYRLTLAPGALHLMTAVLTPSSWYELLACDFKEKHRVRFSCTHFFFSLDRSAVPDSTISTAISTAIATAIAATSIVRGLLRRRHAIWMLLR